MAKCNCFDENLERVKGHLQTNIPEDAIQFKAAWRDSTLFFSGDYVPVNPLIEYSYRGTKKDGTPRQNLTKGELTIVCEYCPFCGRKLDRKEKNDG